MPPGAGAADQPPPRSPHRGAGAGAIMPQSPLRIKQDGKFYERLLTKESSAAAGNLSFRYYWAEPGAVPFVWESQPGTPKDVARMAAGALPAITPPPSYLLRHGNNAGVGGKQQRALDSARHHDQQKSGKKRRRCSCRLKRIRIGFVAGILRRLSLGKRWRRPAQPAAVKVSSSSRWLFSSVAVDTGEHSVVHRDDIAVAAAARAKQQHGTGTAVLPCSFHNIPWLLRFRNSSGSRGGRSDGCWAWA
ncbi:hypothetical protein U9M48_017304 [Paspalum notatum var. saurae]|uniref:Uncharacterized protein n=1 Tax=Paspalum notatum var. saurae TaxID=547442 RepID=A0AAQ3T774_PASNO